MMMREIFAPWHQQRGSVLSLQLLLHDNDKLDSISVLISCPASPFSSSHALPA
jgi:hypothetical protein